jgi:ketosteroid isomerase-like protein
MEEAWRDAVLKENATVMDSLMAADYIAITPNGTMQSREETLANLRSGAVHLTAIEAFDRKVRFYGNTALVTCRSEVTGTTPGGELSGGYRYTRVYVRDAQGKWKIVSFEANKIREPGERK